MRILCQCEGYLPEFIGGAEVISAHLYNHLRDRGHEVLALTSCIGGQPPGEYSHNGIKLQKFEFGEVLQSRRTDDIGRLLRQVKTVIQEFGPDVMHLNGAQPSGFFFLRRDGQRHIPRVLTLHSPLRSQWQGGLQNRLGRESDTVVAVSESVAEDAIHVMPWIRPKLTIIRNALPLPPLQPASLPTARVTFLCLGRLMEDKGIDVAVEALAIVRAQRYMASLVILGDGPQKKSLQTLVHERGLDEQIRFRGWVPPEAIPSAINEATAILVPSRWKEPFGLAALQAAQLGRPVIASLVGGLREIILHGETGLLVTPNNAAALACAMIDLIRTEGLAEKMGTNARSHAERNFDFDTFVSSYERIFSSVHEGAITGLRVP